MKAFVIKNKEGKYLTAETLAETCRIIFEDCKVAKVTIAEGDLVEEIRTLKRAYQSACEKLACIFGECP